MDELIPELVILHNQLRMLTERWLPMALSRIGAPKDQVERLRRGGVEGRDLREQIDFACELAAAARANSPVLSDPDAELPQRLVELALRLRQVHDLAQRDLEAAAERTMVLQRDLIGCVMGVHIHPPRVRAATPSWAQHILPTVMMRI